METAIQVEAIENNRKVKLPDFCDISLVADLKQAFTDLIQQQPDTITLDPSAVEMIDSAAMQLITVFTRAARNANVEIEIEQSGDAFSRAANVLGLDKELGLVPE